MNKPEKEKLVPVLRFPEFEKADGWGTAPLRKLANRQTERNSEGTITHVLTNSAEHGVVNQRAYFDKDIATQGNLENYFIVEEGDYVYNPRISKFAPVGPISKNDATKGVVSPLYTVFRFNDANTEFYAHYFKSNVWHSYMRQVASTGVRHDRMAITNDQFMAMPLPVPLPTEQQKIADCLTSIDELVTAQTQKLDTLNAHKKGLIQQLFPADGETVPKLRFPEFHGEGEWEESALSSFILSLDAGVSVNSKDRPANDTEFGVLKTSAVTKGIFEPDENKVVLTDSEMSRLKEPVSSGTIIISRMNTLALVGANAYVESSYENLFLPDRLWAAKPKEGVSMRFLAFILGSNRGRAALSKLAKGSSGSMKNITKPDVLALSVMAPSPDEQQQIASCLSSLDALITAQTQKLDALKSLKSGLMQQLFPAMEDADA